MPIRPHLSADGLQVHLHHLGVGPGQDQGARFAGQRVDRPVEIDPFVLILQRSNGPRPASRPNVGQASFLSEAAFVLEPDFDRLVRVRRLDRLDKRGALSLHACSSSGFFLGFTGRGRSGS